MFACIRSRRHRPASMSVAVLGGVVCATVATAEPESPAARAVTWADVVRVVDDDPRFTARRHGIAAARARVAAAGAAPNPTLDLSGAQATSTATNAMGAEWEASLEIPLDWLLRRGTAVDAATARVELAAAEAAVLRRDVLLHLSDLFWAAAAAQADVAGLETAVAQMSAVAAAVRRRVEQGEARPVELTRVEIEAERTDAELEAARLDLTARRRALAAWLRPGGRNTAPPARKPVTVDAELTALPTPVEMETALARLRKISPELRVSAAGVRALRAEIDVQRAARVPAFALRPFVADEFDKRVYGAGVAIELPLWNWNSGNVEAAEREYDAGRAELTAGARGAEVVLIEAAAACEASVALASRFQQRLVPLAQKVSAAVERTYALGETGLLELLDARRVLTETSRRATATYAGAHATCARVRLMLGDEQ